MGRLWYPHWHRGRVRLPMGALLLKWRTNPMAQFSLKKLLACVSAVALLAAAFYWYCRPFNPNVSINVEASGDSAVCIVTNHGWQPIWVLGGPRAISDYKKRSFLPEQIPHVRVFQQSVSPAETTRLGHRKAFVFQTRPEESQLQIGVQLYDWRGRNVTAWSEVYVVHQRNSR